MFFGSAVANQAELSLFAELCLQNVLSRDECFIQKINFLHVNDVKLDIEYRKRPCIEISVLNDNKRIIYFNKMCAIS